MASTINAAIELSRINVEKMQERLAEERRLAANFERQGREVPRRNQEEIQGLEELIAERQQYIISREAEREELIARYEEERQRFIELQQRIKNR
jgi:RNase adaptor protein for sRNA GlmZ degradation